MEKNEDMNRFELQPGFDRETHKLVFRMSIAGTLPEGQSLVEDGIGIVMDYEELVKVSNDIAQLVQDFNPTNSEQLITGKLN